MPGAERIPGKHSGGNPMLGGNALCTHHITVTPQGSYAATKAALLREGFEPTLLLDPVGGHRGQFLPANRGGYALQHNGPPTNTEGKIHVQIEWVWPAMPSLLHPNDITKTPHFAAQWHDLILWLDQLGVPRAWPFGGPLATSRDPATWRHGGHRGHRNAPGNSHVDSLSVRKAPAWPVTTYPMAANRLAEVTDLTAAFSGRVQQKHPMTAADRAAVKKLVTVATEALNL